MIVSSEIKIKIEKSLAEFLASNGHDILKWFIEKDFEYASNFIESEEILNAFWNTFVKNGPHDEEIFDYLVNKTPQSHREKITNLLCSLIESKDQNQFSTLIKLFSEKINEWPSEIISKIRDTSINIAAELGHPHNMKLFEIVIISLSRYDSEQLESLGKEILPFISDGSPQVQKDVFNLITLINEKLDRLGNQIGVNESIDKANELFENNDPNVQPYLDFLGTYSGKLTYEQKDKIIHMIKNQIVTSKPENLRIIGLNFIPKLDKYDREKLLDDVIQLASDTQEPNTKNHCMNMLVALKDELSYYKKNKIKKLFGDNVFD